jgi:hypothetical protein
MQIFAARKIFFAKYNIAVLTIALTANYNKNQKG